MIFVSYFSVVAQFFCGAKSDATLSLRFAYSDASARRSARLNLTSHRDLFGNSSGCRCPRASKNASILVCLILLAVLCSLPYFFSVHHTPLSSQLSRLIQPFRHVLISCRLYEIAFSARFHPFGSQTVALEIVIHCRLQICQSLACMFVFHHGWRLLAQSTRKLHPPSID